MPHPFDFEAKCKRKRGLAPTPCLCCPDVCVGNRRGHSIAEVVERAERSARIARWIAAAAILALILWH